VLPISPDDKLFILTGAGVSAESGIPTFRGVNGLWRNYRIEEVASPHAWARDPRLVWEFYSMRRRVALAAKPNPAHIALAKLEQRLEDRLFLCTQILQRSFPAASAEDGFARISAGSAKLPFELDRIFRALDECTVFMAVGTSGVVEPAASFVAQVGGHARTIYVGPEEPANLSAFTECHLGKRVSFCLDSSAECSERSV